MLTYRGGVVSYRTLHQRCGHRWQGRQGRTGFFEGAASILSFISSLQRFDMQRCLIARAAANRDKDIRELLGQRCHRLMDGHFHAFDARMRQSGIGYALRQCFEQGHGRPGQNGDCFFSYVRVGHCLVDVVGVGCFSGVYPQGDVNVERLF
jgi:hypothetical protein